MLLTQAAAQPLFCTPAQDAQPLLYSLVFGEGVVNDATSIVLLRAVVRKQQDSNVAATAGILKEFFMLFFSSLGVGVLVGLVSAVTVRYLFKKHSTDRWAAGAAGPWRAAWEPWAGLAVGLWAAS